MKSSQFLILLIMFAQGPDVRSQHNNSLDSLRSELVGSGETSEKVDLLNEMSLLFHNSGEDDSSFYYAGLARAIGQDLDYKKGIAISYNRSGTVLYSNNSYEKASNHFKSGLELAYEVADKELQADAYNNMGLVDYHQGNYPEAQESYLQALKLLQSVDNHSGIARSYNNLGSVYFQSGDLDEALNCYNSALATQEIIGDSLGIGRSLNNIGGLFLMRGEYNEALEKFNLALAVKKNIKDFQSIGRTYLNVGSTYYHQSYDPELSTDQSDSLFNLAIDNFTRSLQISDSIGNLQAAANTYNNLGSIFLARNNFEDAATNLNKGLEIATKIGSKNDIMASYTTLAIADTMLGNWRSAYYNSQKYLLYHDSIVNDANVKRILETQLNYEFDQKQAKIVSEQRIKDAAHTEQLKMQKLRGWGITVTVGLLLIIIALFINRLRLKQKQNYQHRILDQQEKQAKAIIEVQELERKRVAEDLHDGLGHLLSTAKIWIQQNVIEKDDGSSHAIKLMDQASNELRNVAYNLMPQVLEKEGLIPAIKELVEKLEKLERIETTLHLYQVENIYFSQETEFNLYRIIQEALHNIIKHSEASNIQIQLIGHDDQIVVMVEDNGVGFDSSKHKEGRGINNMKTRTEWLKGTFSLDSFSKRGTTITIEIPK